MLKFCVFYRFIMYLNVDIENYLHIAIPLENNTPYIVVFLGLK